MPVADPITADQSTEKSSKVSAVLPVRMVQRPDGEPADACSAAEARQAGLARI